MEKIKVGITQGDINGVGLEVILKTFADAEMFEICTPVLYGSPKVVTYHIKSIESQLNFQLVESALQAKDNCLNLVNCSNDDAVVEFGVPSAAAGKAAFDALERASMELKEGMIDVLVTAPINKSDIQSNQFKFPGHTEYLAQKFPSETGPLMILMNQDLRVALVTTHVPITKVAQTITQTMIESKIKILDKTLRSDFCIEIPRIAVLALNPHAGDMGLIGTEEQTVIKPAIDNMISQGIQCFGPFSADGFFGNGSYRMFHAVLAMYHDQGLIPFKAIAMDNGVNYTAGLDIIRTSPDHGTAYDIAGKGLANENSMRQAIYAAIDVYNARKFDKEIHKNPLRRQFFDRDGKDDKVNLESADDGQ
ncbi:MAG: 4-hydroxythreonine-4-phosphate dehydrogenase PdxA [Bacteroidaceae bacterium]|nr:4-hydroxythreonine-4-phosphate dehydrogenase PdxA [Bacteroidaceae bacterium]